LNTPSITSIPLSYPAELRYEPRVISGFRSVLEPSDAIKQELLDSAPNRFWGDRLKLQHESLSRMDGFLDSNPESAANPLPSARFAAWSPSAGSGTQYRTLLDDLGTPIGVQQKLMRHSDVRTTMNHYGTACEKTKRRANTLGAGKLLPESMKAASRTMIH